MNAPDLKNPRSGFHVVVLIFTFFQVLPSSVERASKVPMSWLLGSWRRSSHMATKSPLGVAAIQGKNWLFGAGAPPCRLIVRASDHVFPPSWDRLTSMFPFPRPEM